MSYSKFEIVSKTYVNRYLTINNKRFLTEASS